MVGTTSHRTAQVTQVEPVEESSLRQADVGHQDDSVGRDGTEGIDEVLAREKTGDLDVAAKESIFDGEDPYVSEAVDVEHVTQDGRGVLSGHDDHVVTVLFVTRSASRRAVAQGRGSVHGLEEAGAELVHGCSLDETLHEGRH